MKSSRARVLRLTTSGRLVMFLIGDFSIYNNAGMLSSFRPAAWLIVILARAAADILRRPRRPAERDARADQASLP